MTLHWWMHWFWITLLVTLVCSSPILSMPQSGDGTRKPPVTYYPKSHKTDTTDKADPTLITFTKSNSLPAETNRSGNNPTTNISSIDSNDTNATDQVLQWTSRDVSPINSNLSKEDISTNETSPNITALSRDDVSANVTDPAPVTSKKRNNLTRDAELLQEDNSLEVSDSRIITPKPLSLETTYLQTRIPANVESYRRVLEPAEDDGGMDTGAIAGISFASLVLVALGGSTAFVLYRRRYLNKPQTLNDKCSNQDSSGYLDDSTIRDNSEEMYSLDNDSFLNSLEAMTIQNYWTDTVKHTKL